MRTRFLHRSRYQAEHILTTSMSSLPSQATLTVIPSSRHPISPASDYLNPVAPHDYYKIDLELGFNLFLTLATSSSNTPKEIT